MLHTRVLTKINTLCFDAYFADYKGYPSYKKLKFSHDNKCSIPSNSRLTQNIMSTNVQLTDKVPDIHTQAKKKSYAEATNQNPPSKTTHNIL